MADLRAHVLATVLLSSGMSLAAAGGVSAAETSLKYFNIPAQDLSRALQRYALQADRRIIFSESVSAGLKAPAISGYFTADEALSRMLAGTGLAVSVTRGGVVRIHPTPQAAERRPPSGQKSMAEPPPPPSLAIDAASEQRPGPLNLQGVVVTAIGLHQRKFLTSYSISTATPDQIAEKAPVGTTDLISLVPGFTVESTGGEAGNAVYARGIPQSGGYRYIGIQEDGVPVITDPGIVGASPEVLTKIDLTIRSMEAIRGGASALVQPNAAGGVVNFITRKGTPTPEGEMRVQWGDYGHVRLDGYYAGPIDDRTRFMVGGFYRANHGVRDPGFKANRGGQVRASLTRVFPRGELTVSGRVVDDRVVFYTSVPVRLTRDDVGGVAGFDPSYGTLTSADVVGAQVLTAAGPVTTDLSDGAHQKIATGVADLTYELPAGWRLTVKGRLTDADLPMAAVFSVGAAEPATSRLTGATLLAAQAAFPRAQGLQLRFANDPARPVGDPSVLNGNGLVTTTGLWLTDIALREHLLDLRAARTFEAVGTHTLSVGAFYSRMTGSARRFYSAMLQEVRDQARLLDIVAVDATGNVVGAVTQAGFVQYGTLYQDTTLATDTRSLYGADNWSVTERLRIDAGFRWDKVSTSARDEIAQPFNLGDPGTLADDSVLGGSGRFRPVVFEAARANYSVGANYEIAPTLGVFGRYTRSRRFPNFGDNLIGRPVERIEQAEAGLKLMGERAQAFATVFQTRFANLPLGDQELDPATGRIVNVARNAPVRINGVEFEGYLLPTAFFEVGVTATLLDPVVTRYRFSQVVDGVLTSFDLSGARPVRIPKVQVSVRPKLTLIDGRLQLYANYLYSGSKPIALDNVIMLPPYAQLDAGLAYRIDSHAYVAVNATNLTNEVGLTEGNTRGDLIRNPQLGAVSLGRPLLGRSLRVDVGYRF